MIGTSFPEYVLIRTCIILLQYTTPLCIIALIILHNTGSQPALSSPISQVLIAYSLIDILYAIFIWMPYHKRLMNEARHPPPLNSRDRKALYDKCLSHIPDFERYLRLWFLGADQAEIRRDNVIDFILWAFFDTSPENATEQDMADATEYVQIFEQRLGRRLPEGRGNARGLRLTIDAVETRYRTFLWYLIVGGVDFVTHCQFAWNGFQYHAQPKSMALSVTPPRLQSVFARKRSSNELSYWYRPHTATDKVPVVFLHGIGIGLWTYVPFLSRLNSLHGQGGDIGVIAVELLPISFRLTTEPLGKFEFLNQLDIILDNHGWDEFVLAAHSYGTVLASHLIHSQAFSSRIQGVALLDPVSILLHHPDVAYNFTRRKPRQANEWMLWYFASMDPGVAHVLGRHFFWRENIIWKDELLSLPAKNGDQGKSTADKREVAVCLSERDLIVDTLSVAEYLTEGEGWVPGLRSTTSDSITEAERDGNRHMTREGIEVLWFPDLDHSDMFSKRQDQERVCQILRRQCAC